ncbi:hypothetical protein [Sphingobacterium paludis]|uniref:Uncharacterized protein n=1 Tax=Sphingobacterium paludis TaxID=1476465 RepID=A0A4R7D3G9_9SPHI|nr:hypothetical protein [Sphingobacterium paludis]TDS14671.1 hypothetical protein B0I21_103166 [Sphingobacterium paludis]
MNNHLFAWQNGLLEKVAEQKFASPLPKGRICKKHLRKGVLVVWMFLCLFSLTTAQQLSSGWRISEREQPKTFLPTDTIILTDGSFQADSVFGSLEGTWIGQGYQRDADSFWDMKLICRNGRYRISYPSIGCGGKWILAEKKKDKLLFREQIKTGKDACYNNGFILIEPVVDGLIRFSIFYPNLNSLNAIGFLARDGKPIAM